ncbi:hypothetical protein Tco_0680542 [Tanacetum coccineum]|uniref:Uncharacterized protein n=1 Tax=Tanacetum coccineum TaxID=301880 RepID=A0ABQ4XM01_9ASTR
MVERRRMKKKWNDDLLSCHNPFRSFALVERENLIFLNINDSFMTDMDEWTLPFLLNIVFDFIRTRRIGLVRTTLSDTKPQVVK